LDLIDSILPLQFFNFFNAIFILGSIFASMAFASPYMLIPVAALIVGYFFFNMYFTKTYLEIQRQEALSRAPMFSRLGETLRGAATIRAFKMENVFRNLNNFIIDTNSRHRFAQVYVLS
jgi:ABC-type bacteriocin/lantibiotic exporter with double-glycine peptidase domain